MKIKSIFEDANGCGLYAVCYDGERGVDVFRKLMNQWNDATYLYNFFHAKSSLLETDFWNFISIDEAIEQVMDEAKDIENELRIIENDKGNDPIDQLKKIFLPLHNGIFQLKNGNQQYKKAKPYCSIKPMIRLYALFFEESYIITGGVIKLTRRMEGNEFDIELKKLENLKQYIEDEKIYSIEGLLE